MSPAAPTSSTSTQRSASRVSSSTTSKSATSVSASSTSVLANSASLDTRPPVTVPGTSALRGEGERPPAPWYDGRGLAPGLASRTRPASRSEAVVAAISAKAQRPFNHVFRYLRKGTVVSKRVRSQPDKSLGHADIELGGDHAGGLVHGVVEVGVLFELDR